MTIGERVQALIGTLAGGRVFPNVIPQDEKNRPAITYTVVGGGNLNTLKGAGSMRRVRLQVDAIATTANEAELLADAIDAVLGSYTTPACVSCQIFRKSLRDDEGGVEGESRVVIDYSLHVREE